jgi:predicted Fe-Mo cluster-binding NifX family protein
MKRIAIVLHGDGTVAPVDDRGHHFDSVKVYEVDGDVIEEAEFRFAGPEDDRLLPAALKLARVSDVIGQHFEEGCFGSLKEAGIHMWLEAPENDSTTALKAWLEKELPEAAAGARTIHGPEGRRVRQESSRERSPGRQRSSGGVSSPIHGPEI